MSKLEASVSAHKSDLLEEEWKLWDNGREARYHALTRNGAQLARETPSSQRLTEAIRLISRTAEGGAP